MKALKDSDSSPHKGLALLDRSPELVDLCKNQMIRILIQMDTYISRTFIFKSCL